jgi:hypothetical protein
VFQFRATSQNCQPALPETLAHRNECSCSQRCTAAQCCGDAARSWTAASHSGPVPLVDDVPCCAWAPRHCAVTAPRGRSKVPSCSTPRGGSVAPFHTYVLTQTHSSSKMTHVHWHMHAWQAKIDVLQAESDSQKASKSVREHPHHLSFRIPHSTLQRRHRTRGRDVIAVASC